MIQLLLAAVVGAALGSLPFSWLSYRLATGGELRDVGSGNPGATNVFRSAGPAWGTVALALDVGKGTLAAWLGARWAGADGALAATMACVCAHVATPWLGGRGGKGVAPAAGAFALVAPVAASAATAAFLLALAVTRWVSLASVAGAIVLPVAIGVLGPSTRAAVGSAMLALLIAWRHRENFARMRRGTEPRLGAGGGPGDGGDR